MPRKLTTEEFIKKARQVHGDWYDYSHIDYRGNKIKVTIICPEHGPFLQTPNSHLNGTGCPDCSGKKQLTTEEFIEKARQVHGDWYDYSHVDYVNNSTKVMIVCPEHGSFLQIPSDHLGGHGCSFCGSERTRELTTMRRDSFVKQARKIHGDKYIYNGKYFGYDLDMIIKCPIHGEFEQTPHNHLDGKGCPFCGGTAKLDKQKFEEKARKVHGDKYDYHNVYYINNKTEVKIVCPFHGEFYQRPDAHLNGQGCPDCVVRFDHRMLEKWIKENPKRHDEKCLVYLIRIYNDNEDFLKLGITSKDNTNKRFSNTLEISGYSYKIIAEKQTTKKSAILMEKKAKESLNSYSYSPLKRFDGWTECFTLKAKDQIEEMITHNNDNDYSNEKALG